MDAIHNDTKVAYPTQMATDQHSPERKNDVEDVIVYSNIDAALAAKMNLLNKALNELGWTNYHLKLFFLNGFGFAVDSMLTFLIGIVKVQVDYELKPSYTGGAQMGLYVGLLFGALGWGLSADIIGRKWAFNLSLLVASVFSITAGASHNYITFAALVAVAAFGAGGNLVLDTTVFLEYLPSTHQWLVTTMALWWGVGQTSAALLAWAFIPNFSCPEEETCRKSNNMGWRYLYFTCGSVVLVMSILRVTVIRFRETPKYLLCNNKDEEVVALLQNLATKYNRTCSLTVDQLSRHGAVTTAHASKSFSFREIAVHYRGLFSTKKLAYSTCLLWLSWACIGLAYPLYYMFLPEYLATRGAEFGEESPFITWRNYTISNFCAIFGPILAGYITRIPRVGRKYTMVIGALITMAFFFAYTAVRSAAQNLGFNCAKNVAINIYFAEPNQQTLYSYTPEVLPSAHRATGNGTAVSMARIMGVVAVVVGTTTDTSTPVPIFVCAAVFVLMAIIAAVAPFEPQEKQSI